MARHPRALSSDATIAVLVLTPDDEVLRLDGVGAWVWEQLAAPVTLPELVRRAVAAFDVEADRARADIEAFVERLRDAGAVTAGAPGGTA